jgi:uncharacterized protein
MLLVLSPAKTLNMSVTQSFKSVSQPTMLDQSQRLVDVLQSLLPSELGRLMKLSEKLAALNADRYRIWKRPFTLENAAPALFAFQGDVYVGLDAASLDAASVKAAQKHVRILSGLYGVLRPLDLMQAYRLEMGTALLTERGRDLYAFWGNRITDQLNQDIAAIRANYLVNLASNEYFKAVHAEALRVPVITPIFQDEKKGQFKVISFFAKKARGMMARHMVLQRAKKREHLISFDAAGYCYDASRSDEYTLVFRRTEKAAVKASG